MGESALPRLLYWKRDLAEMLGIGIRTLERSIATGEVPPPDRRFRGRPCWAASTIEAWRARGCPRISA